MCPRCWKVRRDPFPRQHRSRFTLFFGGLRRLIYKISGKREAGGGMARALGWGRRYPQTSSLLSPRVVLGESRVSASWPNKHTALVCFLKTVFTTTKRMKLYRSFSVTSKDGGEVSMNRLSKNEESTHKQGTSSVASRSLIYYSSRKQDTPYVA